jgi:hypothetical protein
MKWYNYVACFFAGFVLLNAIPHLTHGISGDAFPSPFANPPGKGLSSPMVNTLWGLLNLLIGTVLFWAGKISTSKKLTLVIFFIGVAASSIMLTIAFVDKMAS